MKPEPTNPTNQITSEHDAGSPVRASDSCTTAEVRAPAGTRRRDSIRLRLASLVIACVLPVWIVAGFLVYYNYQSKRALTEQHMLETARALTMVVDRELFNMQASLSALATSPLLVSGDLDAFYRQAGGGLEAHPGAYILLADATGQELVNTIAPFGATLPKHSVPDAVSQVYATGRPLITNAFKGVFTGRFLVSVHVPVFRDGRVIYDLAMNVPTDRFAKVLLQQQLPPEWIGGIYDSNQVMVARSRLTEKFVSRQAGPVLGPRMRDTAEGTAEGFNFEGGRMFFGFSRSATSGWTVAIGVPKAIMMAEIWHWLRWTIAVTALLSLAGVALALLMARRIAGSIQALIATALALGRGESVVIRHLGLTEFDEAAESLVRASQLIQQRTAERQRAKSARRETGDLKRFNAELERSEAEARALATELAAILDAVPAVTFIARDPECQRITSNRAGYDLLRLPPGANTSRSGSDSEGPMNYRFLRDGRALSPDELPVQLAAAGCEVRDSEYTIAFDDGSSRSVFGNAVPLLDERGRVRGAVGAFIDVTERKHAEKQLQATANRLQAILDNAPVGIVVGTRDYRFVEPNAAFQRMVGYSAEELKQMDREALTHPDDIARNAELVDGLMQGKLKNYELEKRYVLKDGKMIWIRSIGTRLDDEHELSIIEDITERKRTEQVLAESEERLRTIVELAPDGIFVVSNQGQLLAVNQAACKQLGYTRGQLLQLKISDFISPRFAQRVAARLRGQVPDGSYESAHIRADGVEVPVELSVTKILFHGQPAFLGITRDTSDRKRAEEQRKKLEQQLRQAQKMESLGRLAGGIAHDFNNLLMVIQSYTELLEESLPAHDRLRRNTQEIMKAADRAASLTRQMLAFSRKQILSPVVLDLNAVIRETATMLRRLIGEDIDLRVSPAESLWAVEADSDQIAQVLMNLCVNARDAMPQGGTLTIATGNATVAEGGIGGQEYASPGDYVWLSVTDTGAGISKELQGRIFDPFFTTKEVGKGTGLGLATVYGIVKQSGGHVLVDSEVGQGACFTIYLPRVKRAVAAAMPAKAHVQPRRTGMILVAEDEEALREAMCDYLRSLGYTVLGASSGKEALSAVSEHEGHIDLLITDLVMPKMSGRELAQMLGSLRPDLKTIYMSGYTDDEGLRDGIHEQGATFLQKPFSLGTLARKVCETLGQCETVQ